MAIDTAARRASVQAYTLGLMRPPPDGTIAEPDRATVTYLYAGIDYDSVVGDLGLIPIYPIGHQFDWYFNR